MYFLFSLIFSFILLLLVAFLVLFERNVLGLDQLRKSPNTTGMFSVLQTASDSVKLLMKKYFINPSFRFFFFFLSPMMSLFLSIVMWFFLCLCFSLYNLDSSIVVTLFLSGVMAYVVVWSGWGSNNVYSIIGTVRAVAQMISYEVVMGFFIMMFIISFNSFNWFSFHILNLSMSSNVSFVIFFMFWFLIILAELNRTPFDLVEGESELVGGFNVEYSSSGFTMLFLSEYMNIWFMSTLTVVIFFSNFFFFFFSFFMVFSLTFFIIHTRALLPRYKFFDLIFLMWKILLPVITVFFLFFLMFF